VRRVAPRPRPIAPVDAVLISHVHYDHLDFSSLRRVRTQRLVVPSTAGRLFVRRALGGVAELGPGEQLSVGPLRIEATHAEHSARRGLFGPEIPALGYVVSGSVRVYFPGDTDIFPGMRDLQPGLDLALMPVAGWGPRLGPGHLDPARAAEALRLLQPRVAIPIHWGTYRRVGLNRDPATLREPAESFARLAFEAAPEAEIRILAPGESTEVRPVMRVEETRNR
jgi:L-ascorbate metabolism protein UlaG (beta-lactamase superfamily)